MNPKNLKMLFSMVSGELFYVEEDEVKNFGNGHVILKEKPKGNCKKCFGRFHVGYEVNKKYYLPCPRCMRKYADWDAMKTESVIVENTRTTTDLADAAFNEAMKNVPGNG